MAGAKTPGLEGIGKDRRETLLQRRERILGTKSLCYIEPTQKGQSTGSSSKDKRRSQVLQAQRVHRQRTLDYIDELEAEIVRLREVNSRSSQQTPPDQPASTSDTQLYIPPPANITLNVLIRSLNGQVAPGLLVKLDSSLPQPSEVLVNDISQPCDTLPSGMDQQLDFTNEFFPQLPQDTFMISGLPFYEPVGLDVPSPSDLHLESFDASTRMLFNNFSENIAPTLVPFDGSSNGYRTILLPFAYDNELVREALLAVSANHLRFQNPELAGLALNLQSTAIQKLSQSSQTDSYSSDLLLRVLATIVLLLISGMVNGADAFKAVYGIAKSWMKFMGESQRPIQSHLERFLRGEIQMIETYAQPMISGRVLQASTYERAAAPTSAKRQPLNSQSIRESFFALESAIKQACAIYTGHVFSDQPPDNIELLLKDLRDTVEDLPEHLPGENALAWVYFIGAAESSTHFSRNFFAKRLMGIYDRGNADDVTSSFHLLRLIWDQQFHGNSWTEVLKQMPLIFK